MPFAQALYRGLEAEGFTAEVETDGAVALDRLADVPADLIVLDLMLPGLNGFRLVSELRARGDWTPVLVLTAKQGELDQTEVLDSGADDFLSKRVSFPVLVARLRALARRRRNAEARLTAGNLVLDARQHRSWRAADEIDLTPREFRLLAALMEQAGRAVPKQDLLDEVWDFAYDGDPNIVEVYAGYLRRKIDRRSGRQALEPVRGVGYRLRPDGG